MKFEATFRKVPPVLNQPAMSLCGPSAGFVDGDEVESMDVVCDGLGDQRVVRA